MQTACNCRRDNRRIRVAGIPIDVLSMKELTNVFSDYLACGQTHVTHHLAAHSVAVADADHDFMEVLQRADLNLPDGMGVVWAARLMGAKELRARLYGPTAMLEVLRWGQEHGLRHAFVGGTQSTLQALRASLLEQLPRLMIVGMYSPPIREITPEGVEEDLQSIGADADVLWVGLGTPKQQRWAEHARAYRPARVLATVGAAFDFHAGTKPQAPLWMQRAGLEWTFRLASEPRRLWRRYLLGNARFVWAVAASRSKSNGNRA